MKLKLIHIVFVIATVGSFSCAENASETPRTEQPSQRLLLTAEGVRSIKAQEASSPLIAKAVKHVRIRSERAIESGIEVPMPKDPGGGYTHEKHKSNYQDALFTATWFLLSADEAALDHCKKLLLAYAELYPSLPIHPNSKKQAPGKLFWQVLNEEVALVHFIQAYDAIKHSLSAAEQEQIEDGLIRSMVAYIKDETRKTFNSIHNHGMWAVAGVGMSGIVLEDEELVEQALYGTEKSGEAGFFKQIEMLFSPDGYYSEGPYYQRYALMPLALLAQAMEKSHPEKGVFSFRDSVIVKAIRTTVQMSACNGQFFPLNDAIKSKTIQTPELGYALPLWYAYGGRDPRVISLMEENGSLMLTDALIDLDAKTMEPFSRSTVILSDGPTGESGGIAVLREQGKCTGLTAVLKYGTHGMGHGHYDQLGMLVYDQGNEILSDYGAVRYLNIPQKEGGRYLTENISWGKQTIAHNTLVVDEQTQHAGKVDIADASHPWQVFAQLDENIQAVSAADTTAYPGVTLQRVLALVDIKDLGSLLFDITQARSDAEHSYDLPFHFKGQQIAMEPKSAVYTNELHPLGIDDGYQHLWLKGLSESQANSSVTLLNQDRFYTISTCSDQPYQIAQTSLGANDPDQNLRNESSFICRSSAENQTWVSVIEPHGDYNTIREKTVQAESQVKAMNFSMSSEGNQLQLILELHDGRIYELLANLDLNAGTSSGEQPIQFQLKTQ